jgi:Ser/Thr protein kinase RdoA (MazF antagonist)
VQTVCPASFTENFPSDRRIVEKIAWIYEVAYEIIRIDMGRVDLGQARKFQLSFQDVAPLTVGELWALPTMLRTGILDVLAYAISQDLEEKELGGVPGFHATEYLAGIPDGELAANAVLSLRALLEEDWKSSSRSVSLVDQILKRTQPTCTKIWTFNRGTITGKK